MKVNELISRLNCKRLTSKDCPLEFNNVYIGDLLSFVMGHAIEESLWLTIQGHLNVVAIANLKDFAAVVVCEGVAVSADVIEKADEEGVCLLSYGGTLYDLASQLAHVL